MMRPQTIVERLDFVAKRIPGLKFTPPTQLKPGDDQGYGCFMSCDMYYIEIKVDQSHQTVKDVVVSHGNNAEGISCPVLTKVLADQDFETFAKHLTGLHSIYQINTTDKKVKQRAYPAVTALETDLKILYEHQRRRTNNCHDLVHKSPLGIMEPRRGGLPVKLTYFVTPFDLIDVHQRGMIQLTVNNICEKNLGLSVTVEIEGSSPHKLPVKSLISTQHNSSLPAYSPFNSQNSEKLPAQFVLKLSQPLPILNTSIQQIINEVNEPSTIKDYLTSLMTSSKESIITLIARQELDLNKGPFCRSVELLKSSDGDSCDLRKHVYLVKLKDQNHTYHILDNYLERQDGVYVTKVPFTHPTSIPNILRVLRQQALFNFVIGSCIRRNKSNNIGNLSSSLEDSTSKFTPESNIFDVIPVSLTNVCISFEHPSRESLATLEIDFKELSCQLYALNKESVCSNDFATKVLQKCWSIPVTLRSVLKKCNERRLALLEDANKRRERELQELLTNNSAQQGTQYKNMLFQDNTLQSKFNNLGEQSNSNDLNSILTSKLNNPSANEGLSQVAAEPEPANSRSNVLKKFSCKPKTKQHVTTKGQAGNKILSLMLKRQSSNTTADDISGSLRGPNLKKAKTKGSISDANGNRSVTGLTTTKLISPDMVAAPKMINKQSKQSTAGQGISLSLMRSPNKPTFISPSTNSPLSSGISLGVTNSSSTTSSGYKQNDPNYSNAEGVIPTTTKLKSQQVSGNPVNNLNKPRKSSINAVLDRLVGGLTPEQTAALLPTSEVADNDKQTSDMPKTDGQKIKSRTPTDQFAIKQGGGLKLTVTKTKPTTVNTPNSSSSTSTGQLTSATSTPAAQSGISAGSTNASKESDATKILGLNTSASTIKYTIPKISKTQQAAGSTQSSGSNDNTNPSDSNSQGDDSGNPSSSANVTSTPSSTTSKRPLPAAFNRNNNPNRNPVSSSTHPLGRTTSNPLANSSRPSSTSNSNDNQSSSGRISSSNQNMRQQLANRLNMQQQQQQQPQTASIQRLTSPNNVTGQQAQLRPKPPMFALGLSQPPIGFQTPTDLNILAASQAALLNQKRIAQASGPPNQVQPIQPFMSSSIDTNAISSSKPMFPSQLSQTPVPSIAPNSNLTSSYGDSLQRPTTSIVSAQPQFYTRHSIFEESTQNTVSSTPRTSTEPGPSTKTNIAKPSADTSMPITLNGNLPNNPRPQPAPVANSQTNDSLSSTSGQAGGNSNSSNHNTSATTTVNPSVTSSSDLEAKDYGPNISTPSSPVESNQMEVAQPPALIPIDSVDETCPMSPDTDHPDDASDRLSIVDPNENMTDSTSAAGTPKLSSANSPATTMSDQAHQAASSESRTKESTPPAPSSCNPIKDPDTTSTPNEIGSTQNSLAPQEAHN